MGEPDGQEVVYPLLDQTKVGCSINGNEHIGCGTKYTSTQGEVKHDGPVNVDYTIPENAEGMLLV